MSDLPGRLLSNAAREELAAPSAPWSDPNSDPLGDMRRLGEYWGSQAFLDYQEATRKHVEEILRRFHSALETACELALVDPEQRGVLVTWHTLATGTQDDPIWTIELSTEVPPRMIHERRVWPGTSVGTSGDTPAHG